MPIRDATRDPSPAPAQKRRRYASVATACFLLAGCVPYDRYEPGMMQHGPKWYHYALDHGVVFGLVAAAVVGGVIALVKRGKGPKQ